MTGVEVAIETAFMTISVALRRGDQLYEPRIDLSHKRGTSLHPALQDLLAQAGCSPEAITRVYVDVGPGSYTGLRIGLALVTTLRELIGMTIHTVFSTDQIAWFGRGRLDSGEFAVCLDARRAQWFFARYRKDATGELVRLVAPQCLRVEELRTAAAGAGHVLTASDEPPLDLPCTKVGVPPARQLFELEALAKEDPRPGPVYLMAPT